MSGFIKLQRDIEGTWIHDDDRYFKAWCTILLNVNWKPSKVRIGSKLLNCDVNEALFSLDTWAKKFGKSWSKEQVRRFFKRLEGQHYISTKGDTKTTRLRVLDSELYENQEHDNDTIPDTKPTRDPTPIEEERIKKEELRTKLKEEKYKKEISDLKTQLEKLTKGEADSKESFEFIDEVREVLEFFVSTTGKQIRIGRTNSLLSRSDKYKKILPRLRAGATVEECKNVIALKNNQWKDDKNMKSHICIPTLFRASNFEKYLDELESTGQKTKTNLNFSYEIPQFETKEQRYMYFLARYSIYKESGMLDEYKANTEYRKRAIMQQDAESLCFELELQQPELLDLEFNYVQR